MIYAGVCYDGPYQGRWYSSERAAFRVAVFPELPVVDLGRDPDAKTVIAEGWYKWSEPVGKWVWVW